MRTEQEIRDKIKYLAKTYPNDSEIASAMIYLEWVCAIQKIKIKKDVSK